MTANNIKIGQWLDMFRNNEKIKNNVFITDEDVAIDVTLPNRYDAVLPEIKGLDQYKTMTLSDIYDYFADFLDDNIRVAVINDVDIRLSRTDSANHCNYCNSYTPLYRYCTKCNKYMCKLCWEEKTEEIAISNGAKNWNKRKTSLLTCFGHVEKIEYNKRLRVNCDICGSDFEKNFGIWKHNRVSNKDICAYCIDTDEAKIIIAESTDDWVVAEHPNIAIRVDFGSFLDWVPLLEHKDGDAVFYNINPDSPLYHKVILRVVDNHGRCGYFVVDKSLNDMLEELQEEREFSKDERNEGVDTQIKKYIFGRGWNVYYG